MGLCALTFWVLTVQKFFQNALDFLVITICLAAALDHVNVIGINALHLLVFRRVDLGRDIFHNLYGTNIRDDRRTEFTLDLPVQQSRSHRTPLPMAVSPGTSRVLYQIPSCMVSSMELSGLKSLIVALFRTAIRARFFVITFPSAATLPRWGVVRKTISLVRTRQASDRCKACVPN